ncbi:MULTISPECIES: pseudouridine synthase [unclassified Rhizobacter]|uniref:pseudouridine synthase n=1 Tax=unclassified Rhizobacter TaxID=2640088 RepID=UPI0006FCE6EA|nr:MULTISPECIES: pseudouridine synthase [unclassified Rhizobacter]KQU80738.1 RNA pseudouridine synthase [Rhizobacter sp. Root29]KQW04281.1 RNA pseudouridine synthase [Rhizobacter sp. Root1238]KRB14597.1 RNA pseudouridine synthase [Rhizobacter sp. Root16D2]
MSPALLYLDESMLVVDKPSGLLAVLGRGEAGLDNQATRVQAEVADALVVHRLDMSTSGLMLFARGKEMQRRLSHAFAQREVRKEYVAVVDGLVGPDHGEIDLPLLTDWPNRPRQKVDHVDGKPALTRFSVLQRDSVAGTTRLRLEPVTGRSHQLRVHLLALGHPIAGDALYAPPDALAKAPRLLLHAQSLQLAHPLDGRPMRFHSPAPF